MLQHDTCNAFAFSGLESKCFLYAKGRDLRPVKLDGFTLYVQLKGMYSSSSSSSSSSSNSLEYNDQ